MAKVIPGIGGVEFDGNSVTNAVLGCNVMAINHLTRWSVVKPDTRLELDESEIIPLA